LFHQKIAHAYERRIPIEEEIYCDFFLPLSKVYIEYWGLEEKDYLQRKEAKKWLYDKYQLHLIELFDEHIYHLDDRLPVLLKRFFPETYKFD
jgi:hypothetical protein